MQAGRATPVGEDCSRHPAAALALLLVLLGLLLSTLPAAARDWTGSAVDRGYVLSAEPNRQANPRRQCVPRMLEHLDRRAVVEAPPGGWPGEPQAVAVFNIHGGEVMIAHGGEAVCGRMHDMDTRDSRFRAGVGQVVVPRRGDADPIVVAWQTPLLPEWVPTIRLGSPNHLQFEDTARLLLRASCMAVAVALALSALMGWLAVRELPFLFYTTTCALLFLWQGMINGLVGYPRPWFPMEGQLAQWHVLLSLLSTVVMLLVLGVLSHGQVLWGRFWRWIHVVVLASLAIGLGAFLLPPAGLRALAVLTLVLMAAGSFLMLALALAMLVRRRHQAVLGLVAVLPFLAIVIGEMVSAGWWIQYRVESQQLAATWLLMIAAYALNRRLGLIRIQRDEMRRLADTDSLTGLANRRHGMQRLRELHAQAAERGLPLSVAFLDVDHFKSINDSCGHEAGDQVLLAVAGVILEAVRGHDDVVRMGGEEFLVLLPGVTAGQARERMEQVRERVAMLSLVAIAPGLKVSVSIGVAQLQPSDITADDLLRRADRAMYQAKQAGRDRVHMA